MAPHRDRRVAVSAAGKQSLEGASLVVVEHGKPLEDRLRREHLSTDDILTAARAKQGLLRMDQIEYAVLESSGGISIIPARVGLHRESNAGVEWLGDTSGFECVLVEGKGYALDDGDRPPEAGREELRR